MSISAIGTTPAYVPAKTSEQAEGPGPDKVNDHDSDDRAAAQPAGVGQLVDQTA